MLVKINDNIAKTYFELDKVNDLVVDKVELDSVVNLDQWVWVTDSTTIVGDNEWNTTSTDSLLLNLKELELSLLIGDTVDSEATLNVVENTEVFS